MQDYHQLDIWNRAMAYTADLYRFSAQFPDTERYNLTAQLRRAATSVPLNIAEGAGCTTNGEFARFLGYAYRSLIDAGAKLAFGSDWPVAPLDVLAGIDAAVNRRTLGGKHPDGWFPEQRISVAEAVEAYTLGSAFGGH